MYRLIVEQRPTVVRDERHLQGQLAQPGGRFLGTVEMDLFFFPSQVMREAVKG
ncbi:hypothetical protein D9M68_801980 [compost metagenome]